MAETEDSLPQELIVYKVYNPGTKTYWGANYMSQGGARKSSKAFYGNKHLQVHKMKLELLEEITYDS